MAEILGIFPNIVGSVENNGNKTATEINTKTQGQMTRLSMIIDIINQDLVIPNVQKVAKLCADFKSGVETIFVNSENKQDVIEVDDTVRQGDYKYMYSDPNMINQKAEQADMVVQAVQQFGQQLPLNLKEIFIWYFEQRGVDNPERFLGVGVNEDSSLSRLQNFGGVGEGVNENGPLPQLQGDNAGAGVGVNGDGSLSRLQGGNAGVGVNENGSLSQPQGVNSEVNPADVMSQLQGGNVGAQPQNSMDVIAKLQSLAQQSQQPGMVQVSQTDNSQAIETILALLFTNPLIMQKLQEVVGKEKAEKFMEELEDIQEEMNNAI